MKKYSFQASQASLKRSPWSVAIMGLGVCYALAGCVVGVSIDWPLPTDAHVEGLRHTVVDLSHPDMEGRGAGTAGLDRAKDYLVDRFQAVGLQPAFVIEGQPSYTQPFEINLGVEVEHQSLNIQPDAGEVLVTQPGQEFNTLGFSGSGGFGGPAIFVGYGIVAPQHGYDSYGDLPEGGLKGKVAVAFRYEPQDGRGKSKWAGQGGALGGWSGSASLLKKAKWAAQRGAIALLVVNPPSQDQGDLKSTRRSVAPDNATLPVLHISSVCFEKMIRLTGRDPLKVIGVYQKRADQGHHTIELLHGFTLSGRVDLKHPKATIANVAGVWPGRGGLADQVVVVGAHYDHLGYGDIGSLSDTHEIHPGADDNASGVAGMLLLAKQLQEQSQIPLSAPTGEGDRRAVLFMAFSGEERGLLGSSHTLGHLDELNLRQEQLVAMINFDMIGRMKGNTLHVMGTGSGKGWGRFLKGAAKQLGLDLRVTSQSFGGSDHTSFQVRGVPALHFFTGSHEDYHRPSDTAQKINPRGAARTVALAGAMLDRLCVQRQRITFVPDSTSNPHAMGSMGGSGAYLGVVPDYASLDGSEGCRLSGVVPGSPAKAAGLEPGDTIVGWGDKPVPNVRGLTARLGESKPGETPLLKVRRDGKLIELKVTLGQRSH